MSRCDLFSWSDEAEAAKAVEAAEAERLAALKKALYAPHGEVQTRRQRVQAATAAALAAEIELARIQRALR
ncbi:MAG: hypothetical protein U1C74_02165 [Phenylobacterium sp.]|nr:hypothetical protein [Phenylobacterium sp.]